MTSRAQSGLVPVSLEAVLLFTLGALDVVWLRTVLPLPVWSTIANCFWVLAIVCLGVDLAGRPWATNIRTAAVAASAVLLLVVSTLALVGLRRQFGPASYVHDNAILIEEGVKQLLSGHNFYTADYRGTALAAWQGGQFYDATSQTWFPNPALFHYITLPFYTLGSAAVAVVSLMVVGFYDQRFTHLLALGLLAGAAWTLPRRRQDRISYLIVLLLNPLAVAAITMGTSDIFVLAWLIAAIAAFAAGRGTLGAVSLALAATSKQTAWVVLPLVAAYWWWAEPRRRRELLWLPGLALAIIAPFALWNWPAFWDDVYRYPAGTLPTSYPIYGLGLSVLLQLVGFPPSPRAYFPYSLLQLALAGPLLAVLLWWQRRDNTMARAVAGSAVFLLVFWWLSRFFNENYLWVVVALLATEYVLNDHSDGKHSVVGAVPPA